MRLVISTSNEEEAPTLARTIVEEGLAACVNIVPAVRSIYSWEGEICDDGEALLLMKTTAERAGELTERVRALHSYDVPEVICLEITDGEGNPDYLSWLRSSVKGG